MITIVLDAHRIPDGTEVRKLTGQKVYVLQRQLKIYMPGERKDANFDGFVFLTSDRSINGYPDTNKFAIDLPDEDAVEFVEKLLTPIPY